MNEKENRPRERTVTREDGTVERYPVIERKVRNGNIFLRILRFLRRRN